jgi:hypothetical protein
LTKKYNGDKECKNYHKLKCLPVFSLCRETGKEGGCHDDQQMDDSRNDSEDDGNAKSG